MKKTNKALKEVKKIFKIVKTQPSRIKYLSKEDPKVAKISKEIERFNSVQALGYEGNQYANIGYISALIGNNIINRKQGDVLKKAHVFSEEDGTLDEYIVIDSKGRLTREIYD